MTGGVGSGVFFDDSAPTRLVEGGSRWPRPKEEPTLFVIDATPSDATARLGEPIADDDDVHPGLGRVALWAGHWRCGCEVVLWWPYHEHVRIPPGPMNVATNDPDAEHVAHHVTNLGWRILERWSHRRPPRDPDPWSLVRQGDDGNRVVVRTFDSKIAAECAQRTFEERGHKQLYTVERPPR